jgi:DNA processing protein
MALALHVFSGPEPTVTMLEGRSPAVERWAWVALALVRPVATRARAYHDLLRLGSPADVFQASRRALAEVVGEEAAAAILALDWRRAARDQAAAATRCGARLVLTGDADYPAALRPIDLPPPFLLVRGETRREDALAIAIVGSRKASPYGVRMAEQLAGDLAARGVTVVSGLARGVDTAAHRGAVGVGGRTIAVLGSGVDVVYPPENRRLATDVAESGAVVSQFPMGTPPLPQHFPARNRVIAGLALGTVVVEAAERSGALITARCAGELGREVYAVPGSVSAPGSQGTHALIQDGAKLVQGWQDVVGEWPQEWRRALRVPGVEALEGAGGGAGQDGLLALLGDEPMGVDAMVERTGLAPSEVAAGLTELELLGLARRTSGQHFVRTGATRAHATRRHPPEQRGGEARGHWAASPCED